MKSYLQKNNIEILANTENVQVVRNKKTDIWQMIFIMQESLPTKT